EELSERFWKAAEPIWASNEETYADLAEELDSPLASALLAEIMAIDSREAFEARGLDSNGLWAIHGLSIYPMVHWQLVDAQAFEAMLDRAATEAGTDLPKRSIGEQELIWVDLGGFGLAVHHDDRFVTAALVPDEPDMLRRVANLDRPDEAFRPDSLSEFNRERGFAPQGSGYFDFTRLVDRLLDTDSDPIMAGRHEKFDGIADNTACQSELRALTGIVPRLSGGYTQLSDREVHFAMSVETDSEFGGKLAGIADSPVSFDKGEPGLLSAGLSINIVAARDFAREIVDGWVEQPPECPLFSNIRENAEDWQLGLNRPIPPVVTNLQGFRVQVDHVETGGETGIRDVAGTLAIFMRNPQMMIGMAQMFSPELAELDLTPGKEPQPLPPGMVPNLPEGAEAFIAMGENALGLALGSDQRDRIVDALQPGEADSTLFRYAINWPAYIEMMEAMMAQTRSELAEMDTDIEMPDNEDMFAGLAEVYQYSDTSIELSEAGIRIASSMRLAE
ncbi:MAG: hypothetical protein ACOCSR_03720, partial [Wenzhouxiangella sp.]